ncbi:hypothetical protein BGZ80_000953 [Entomortierella chlamydospora]|uniref:F-box domain-containing protein n=1 Tax=Entomortierella chlamydospora TaxID=101097 RepID=A0A9P6T417_9FUNG|nr:hypothetical protein BGZ80_000953 [Entomortierella chlamydospora]
MTPYERASSQALGIAEILHHISSYLENDDLITTIQVCKNWHTSLHSRLFRNIIVSYIPKDGSDIATVPPFSVIRANSHKIKSLTIIHRPPSRRFVEYLKLRDLSNLERFAWVRGGGGSGCHITRDHWRRVLDFLRANGSTLKEVNIEYYNLAEIAQLWKVLAQHCTSLQHLRIQRVVIQEGDHSWFWLSCRKLVSLEMDNVRFYWPNFPGLVKNFHAEANKLQEILDREEPKAISESPMGKAFEDLDDASGNNAEYFFPYMKRLHLYGNTYPGEVPDVMKECPKLESIRAATGIRIFHALESSWPNLHSISLPETFESDRNMARLITLLNPHIGPQDYQQLAVNKSRRSLKALRIPYTTFGTECWEVLQFHQHTETLEHLNIKGSTLRDDELISILRSCPRLKSLVAPILHVAYINEGQDQPWACLGLERLIMGVEFLPNPRRPAVSQREDDLQVVKKMQQDFLNQLCRLHRLKSLVIGDYINGDRPFMGLSLKLDDGLGQLDGLRDLEEVSFVGSKVAKQDVEWMAEHWKRLRRACKPSISMMPSDHRGLTLKGQQHIDHPD